MREQGLRLPSCAAANFVPRIRKLHFEPASIQLVQPLLDALEVLDRSIYDVEQRLAELAALEPAIAQLGTAPGVGMIVAASFISVVDDAHRFRRAHQVESYIGLVPSENSSGGAKRRLGAITKQGNSYLRSLLVQAGWVILRLKDRNDPLHRWAQAVAARRGRLVAVVAVARRLAGLLWAMWRDGTVYDPAFAARTGARGLRAAAQTLEFRAAALTRAATKARYSRTPRPEVTN
jgi:transposase